METVWIVAMYNCDSESHDLLTVTATLELAREFCKQEKARFMANENAMDEDGYEEELESYDNIEVWLLNRPRPMTYDGFLIKESEFKVPPRYILK
jgi:hypothetical protein